MNTFKEFNLHSNIYKAIAACGYTKPTPVQSQSIPEVMQGRDVVVSAQTGTGKTAAFVLPALHNLSSLPQASKKPRVLILTPTRELASQITKAAGMYGKFLRFNIVSLVGGMPYHHQIKDLSRGADIIVATPGRLLDHMDQKRVDLSAIEMLVLDEADRMLDMGFIDDVQYIAKLTPSQRQTLLFSATLDNKLMAAVKHLLKNPVRIDLSNQKIASPQIVQHMYKANNAQHKTRLLRHFLTDENIYKAIIFSATKINADKLANQLRDEGFAAAALHGDLRQNVRNRTLEQLRRGKIQFLVATDVAARGIDVSDITHVFNYDLPRFCEDYVHRIGRTGRAGRSGVAISFVLPTDNRHLRSIEKYMGQRINLIHHVEMRESSEHSNAIPPQEILTLKKEKTHSTDKFDKFSRGTKKQPRNEKANHFDRRERETSRASRFERFDKTESSENYRPKKKFTSNKKNQKHAKNNRFSDSGANKFNDSAKKKNPRSFKKRPANKDRGFTHSSTGSENY